MNPRAHGRAASGYRYRTSPLTASQHHIILDEYDVPAAASGRYRTSQRMSTGYAKALTFATRSTTKGVLAIQNCKIAEWNAGDSQPKTGRGMIFGRCKICEQQKHHPIHLMQTVLGG